VRLTLLDSTGGASASAGTAANASVLVDLVDVAFADSSDGALIDAGAASNADVSNSVSHFVFFFLGLILQYSCLKQVQKYYFFSIWQNYFTIFGEVYK
jgi:hypothetical protein